MVYVKKNWCRKNVHIGKNNSANLKEFRDKKKKTKSLGGFVCALNKLVSTDFKQILVDVWHLKYCLYDVRNETYCKQRYLFNSCTNASLYFNCVNMNEFVVLSISTIPNTGQACLRIYREIGFLKTKFARLRQETIKETTDILLPKN